MCLLSIALRLALYLVPAELSTQGSVERQTWTKDMSTNHRTMSPKRRRAFADAWQLLRPSANILIDCGVTEL